VSPACVANQSRLPTGKRREQRNIDAPSPARSLLRSPEKRDLTPYRIPSTHTIGGVAELLFCTLECVACDLLSSKTGRQELAFCDVVDSLLQIGERGENLVKAHWIGEIHVPHCLVVASQRWQPLRSRDKPKRAGLGLVVVRP